MISCAVWNVDVLNASIVQKIETVAASCANVGIDIVDLTVQNGACNTTIRSIAGEKVKAIVATGTPKTG